MTIAFARAAVATEIIRYAQVWEDCRVLRRALAVTPDDHVLSIGSAGCNVLALLLDEPRRITAIDLNPAQAALVELKLAGIRLLSYEELVCLVGARDGYDRLGLYDRVRTRLSPAARRFWDERPAHLVAGVMHTGRLDRYFQGFQRDHLPSLVPAGVVAELLSLDDRAAQRALFDRHFDTPAFRACFASYFGREAQAREGRDPSQLSYVGDVDVTGMLWERFRYACTEIATRGNFYLEYFFTSRYRDLELGPPYLGRYAFERLRNLVDRVEIVTAELGRHLDEVAPGHYSKANLSDLFEYLSEAETEAIFGKLVCALRPGGRLCYWNLFVPRAPAAPSRARLRPHTAAAEALWRSDRAFFYRAFHLEEVLP
jgi:S-adenosylmethionine-diacylglycerol 3-amino-3-carboxypropyl transferase